MRVACGVGLAEEDLRLVPLAGAVQEELVLHVLVADGSRPAQHSREATLTHVVLHRRHVQLPHRRLCKHEGEKGEVRLEHKNNWASSSTGKRMEEQFFPWIW